MKNTTRRRAVAAAAALVLGSTALAGTTTASAQEIYPGSGTAVLVEFSSQMSSNDTHPGSSKGEWQQRVDAVVHNPLREIVAPYLP